VCVSVDEIEKDRESVFVCMPDRESCESNISAGLWKVQSDQIRNGNCMLITACSLTRLADIKKKIRQKTACSYF